MSTTTNIDNKKNNAVFAWIEEKAESKLWFRLLGEMLSAFFFIFTINLILALGESGVPVLNLFYKYNLATAIWIGSWTLIAFIWMQGTTLSANFVNLIITRKNNKINNDVLLYSTIMQFIGGIAAALFVYLIVKGGNNSGEKLQAMGGALPKLKGLVSNNVSSTTWYNPWESVNIVDKFAKTNVGVVYAYAALQGLINASFIIVSYVLNKIVTKKTTRRSNELLFRYIILVIGISITTIFCANTTNWIRLFTPTVINAVMGEPNGWLIMNSTLVFVAIQSIGLVIVFYELLWKKQGKEEGK